MEQAAFEEQLARDGYDDVRVVDWAANNNSGTHVHGFSARGLLLSGSVTVKTDTLAMACQQPGDTFALEANTPHIEDVGPDGARLLIGRKF